MKEKTVTIHAICQWCFEKLEAGEEDEMVCPSHRREFGLEPVSKPVRIKEGYEVRNDIKYPLIITPRRKIL
jgi:hypothetical protein